MPLVRFDISQDIKVREPRFSLQFKKSNNKLNPARYFNKATLTVIAGDDRGNNGLLTAGNDSQNSLGNNMSSHSAKKMI